MDRSEAVIFLQEVLVFFTGNSINSFGLISPSDVAVGEFKIFFKGNINDESRRNIMFLVENHQLHMKEENGLVIYD